MINSLKTTNIQCSDKLNANNIVGYSHKKLLALVEQHGTPTVIIDGDKLSAQYNSLVNALPNVRLHYAIKALPNKNVLKHLNSVGCHFDVATSGEIELLKELKIKANKTIHTHPIKKDEEIKKAIAYGTKIFVVDNLYEIEKFIPYKDKVELLIRVNFRNKDAVVDLSRKFGCELSQVPILITKAHEEKIKVAGLSFHVGSQVPSSHAHVDAINQCSKIFNEITNVDWKILDIGGGFPIDYNAPSLEINDFCKPINKALGSISSRIKIIAEPGRYIVGPCAIQLLSVAGMSQRGEKIWYYLDDGVYGVLSGQIYDHANYPITPIGHYDLSSGLYPSVLAGPTCDSIDVINNNILLPKLKIGDSLVATQIGAYTLASATEFNLYKKANILFINNEILLLND